jgi:uncharacterized protein YbgA (DUF1722 family)/uncharacterized protein YbbK (DUF523 family)
MIEFEKPNIVISKCIEFDHCRYNAQVISSDFVKKIKPYVKFLPICAEVEISLGIPRDPIRIVNRKGVKRLIQPATNRDVSNLMNNFSNSFLNSYKEIDGFLLKSQSPSCGLRDVKIYPTAKNASPIFRESGFFGEQVFKKYGYLVIEDENRLRNPVIREHFLRKVFTFCRFRLVKKSQIFQELIRFHTENKFLLMAYNQKELKELGKILANQNKILKKEVFLNYENHLYKVFQKAPRVTSDINVLMHMFGYISSEISTDEKKFFFSLIDKFRNGKIPLSAPLTLLRSWVIHFNQKYLLPQTYFRPYPDELLDVETINLLGVRDFWK